MQVRLIIFRDKDSVCFGIKTEFCNLIFCHNFPSSKKTRHLITVLLVSNPSESWIEYKEINGIVIKEYMIGLKSREDKIIIKKLEEFKFLEDGYNRTDS